MLPCNPGKPLPENGVITLTYTISSHTLLTCHTQLGWQVARAEMLGKGIQAAKTSFYDLVKTMGDMVLTNNTPAYTLAIVQSNHMS